MSSVKEGLWEAIKTRRSTRSYKPDPLPEELIGDIVEAGRFAPSGSNNQTNHFIVVTSPEKMSDLRDVVTGVLANTPVHDAMPPQFAGLIKKAKQGQVDINYGAPVLILVANKVGYVNAKPDCACAIQNMMLMAAVEEIGSCWINQYHLLGAAPALRKHFESLGLAEDEEVYGALVIGYTDKLEQEPLPRNGNPVTFA